MLILTVLSTARQWYHWNGSPQWNYFQLLPWETRIPPHGRGCTVFLPLGLLNMFSKDLALLSLRLFASALVLMLSNSSNLDSTCSSVAKRSVSSAYQIILRLDNMKIGHVDDVRCWSNYTALAGWCLRWCVLPLTPNLCVQSVSQRSRPANCRQSLVDTTRQSSGVGWNSDGIKCLAEFQSIQCLVQVTD